MKSKIELTRNQLNGGYHMGDTLFNNQLVLRLAKRGYYHIAMGVLAMLFQNSTLQTSVRGDVLCKEFADTHFGTLDMSGWSYIYHPDAVSKQNAVKIAQANLLYIINPVHFFKNYSQQSIQDSLHWLSEYYNDLSASALLSKILKQAHISYVDNTGHYVYVIAKGSKRIIPDNANDGTGDTGAWIIGNAPKTRKINHQDINNLINLLRRNHMLKHSFEKGTKQVDFDAFKYHLAKSNNEAYL